MLLGKRVKTVTATNFLVSVSLRHNRRTCIDNGNVPVVFYSVRKLDMKTVKTSIHISQTVLQTIPC